MLTVKMTGFEDFYRNMDDLIKNRYPKVAAITLTEVAKSGKAKIEQELPKAFDRPNRWTMDSVYYLSATPATLEAKIWFKDRDSIMTGKSSKGHPASVYLYPEVHGGERNLKAYEKALQRFGVLPSGYYTVPGEGVKLDSYGNIPSGTITEILTGVGALVGMSDTKFYGVLGGYKRRKKTTANFFVVKEKHGGLVPGIWQRLPEKGAGIGKRKGILTPTGPGARQKGQKEGKFYSVIQGRAVRPILIFVKRAPQYKIRLPFYTMMKDHLHKELPVVFARIARETLEYHRGRR